MLSVKRKNGMEHGYQRNKGVTYGKKWATHLWTEMLKNGTHLEESNEILGA